MNQKLFSANNEAWWNIGFSMLMSSGLIIEPQLLCSALEKGNLSSMWIYWSSFIGSSFGLCFFAHLWQKVPVQTENEIIFYRYSGKGARLLHFFRSLYLGLLIIPFLLAFSLLGISNVLSYVLQISTKQALWGLFFILTIFTFFNSFWRILRIDFILFISFITVLGVLLFLLYMQLGIPSLGASIKQQQLQLFPKTGTVAFSVFLGYVMVQWWSASILDFPDMNGQKLLAASSWKAVVKSFFIPQLLVFLCKFVLFVLPFVAVLQGYTKGIENQELAFSALFVSTLPHWAFGLVVVFFMIPFLSFIQNNQNWAGSLLVANFYSYYLDPKMTAKKELYLGKAVMLYTLLAGILISFQFDSLLTMVQYLFAITAGVGPVFMLRWYWWRINAWTQLSAMLAGIVYPILYVLMDKNWASFHQLIQHIQVHIQLDAYLMQLLLLTLAVTFTWVFVCFITPPTKESQVHEFVHAVRPGGFWPKQQHNFSAFFGIRLGAWALKTASGFAMYLTFWHFILENYLAMGLFFVLFILSFMGSYGLLSKANKQFESQF